MARALVLRHHDEDNPGLIGEALEQRGFALDVYMMNEEAPTPSIDGYDMLVVLGSKESVYDDEVHNAWFGRELEVLARARETGVPIFGICFGAQALCRSYGGQVVRSDNPEVGWYTIDDVAGKGIAPGPWFEFHYDECLLPADAEVWATSEAAVQVFALERNLGVQFHPELDHFQLGDWLETASGEARDFGHDIDELMAFTEAQVPAARERAATLVDQFLDHAGLSKGA